MSINIETNKRVATVGQLSKLYPSFSQSSIRYLLFNKNSNGLSRCVRKIGRKILIDLDCFESWIDEHKGS